MFPKAIYSDSCLRVVLFPSYCHFPVVGMSDDGTEWQPQTPPASLTFARSSSVGWRHNIPSGLHLCRKRAGSDGITEIAQPSVASPLASRKESKAVTKPASSSAAGQNVPARKVARDGLRQHPVDQPRLDGFRPRSSSLVDNPAGGISNAKVSDPAATLAAKRSKSQDDVETTRTIPHIPKPSTVLARSTTMEKAKVAPRSGQRVGPVAERTLDAAGSQRETRNYAAATSNAKFLSVIPDVKSEKSSRSVSASVSASTSPLSVITTFKLCTPADSPDTPNSPSPWDTNGPHERLIDGIEFEMLDAPTTQPQPLPTTPVMLVSPFVESPASTLPTTLPRVSTPQSAPPDSCAQSVQPLDMDVDILSSEDLPLHLNTLTSSRASSFLLPETMMPGISRRLSEVSTGSRTTIMINGSTILIPKLPPPPPPKTPGPSADFTSDVANRASRRLTRAKSYSALPPSCPKGTLPRPVSKFNPSLPEDFQSRLRDAPPVPKIPSTSHTPNVSITSIASSSSSDSSVSSQANKISLAASGSPQTPRNGLDVPRRPGPPPARPPPPPPLNLSGLGILEIPVVTFSKSNPVSRRPSNSDASKPLISHSKALKRQSSGSDKDGRKPTEGVKKRDSGIKTDATVVPETSKKLGTSPVTRTKSQARRAMVKKMALDNIGAVKVRDTSRSPRKPKKEDQMPTRPALLRHENETTTLRPQSRNTMLRIQANEQEKVESLNGELALLEKQCAEAKRHHEALHVARQRLFQDFPDDNKSISSVYFDDEDSSNGSGPMSPGKEEALADIDGKIIKWKRELQQNEHKRNRIKKKLAWHSTDRLCVKPLPERRTPSPHRHQVKTPRVVSPMTARSCNSDLSLSSADIRSMPTLPTPKSVPTEVPDKMPELDDAGRPSMDSTASLPTPPESPLTRSNEPWIGLESPFTPFLDTPTRAASMVSALNVRHGDDRQTVRLFAGEGVAAELRSPEPRLDRQMTIQVFADSGITDLVASLQQEIDTLSRRVRV